MIKLPTVAAIAAMALFATASMHTASAAENDFHGYTKMPSSSAPHAYTPAPAQKAAPTYSPYTKMPSGSVAQAPQPNSQTDPNTKIYPPPNSQDKK